MMTIEEFKEIEARAAKGRANAGKYADIFADLQAYAGVSKVEIVRSSRYACSNVRQRMIRVMKPTNDFELMVAAHECGHVATSTPNPQFGAACLLEEFHATRWAIDTLTKIGATVTDDMKRVARAAIASYAMGETGVIAMALGEGIPDEVRHFLAEEKAATGGTV